MPKRPCLGSPEHPRCPNYAEYRGRCRCCYRAIERERNRRRRAGPARALNTRKWRYTRRKKLFDDPICEWPEGCDRLAEHVHHRKKLSEGGDPFAFSNLMSLCASHHEELHRREGRE